jgi:hypothetical protein
MSTVIYLPRFVAACADFRTDRRFRPAASIRYLGDDVRFARKSSEMTAEGLSRWKLARTSTSLVSAEVAAARALAAGGDNRALVPQSVAMAALRPGDRPDAHPLGRLRFPQVWPPPPAPAHTATSHKL